MDDGSAEALIAWGVGASEAAGAVAPCASARFDASPEAVVDDMVAWSVLCELPEVFKFDQPTGHHRPNGIIGLFDKRLCVIGGISRLIR